MPAEDAKDSEHADLPLALTPVAIVKRNDDQPHQCIEVFPEFSEALLGVDDLAHLTVLYWMHRLKPEERRRLQVHPRGDRTRPRRGVFALRSPMRPNPIGVTTVTLVRRESLCLYVEGLDALDGAPVLDIKHGRVE